MRGAQRDSDYAYRLAVDPPAAKELRLFGLVDWTMERFISRRKRLHELQYTATRLRERSLVWSVLVVVGANLVVFWSMANAAAAGSLELGRLVTFAQTAVGASMIAFGGLSWALDGAAAPVAAALRLKPSMRAVGALSSGERPRGALARARDSLSRRVFAYPAGGPRVLDGFDITIPAGSSLAIVGPNGAGKTTLAKLLCRLYDPLAGAIEIDGVDLREFELEGWRARVTAVFQDFIRFELPLRDNVAPRGAPRCGDPCGAGAGGCRRPGRPRHRARARLPEQHRSLGRAVAARCPGAGAVRDQAGCGSGPARRADRAAGRPRRSRNLRSHSGRHTRRHDHLDLASLLDRAPRRPHLRARARPRGRTGQRTPS